MFKTVANTPALALGFAGLSKPLLCDGALPRWYKELVATRMSVLQGSHYAVTAHSISARQKGGCARSTLLRSRPILKAGLSRRRKNWACAVPTGCIVPSVRAGVAAIAGA